MRKGDVLELVRMDPLEVAQHLSLLESDLYRKIRPQECFLWSKIKEGDVVKNIHSFCAAHDRLADWVKCSILEVSVLGKRSNVIDFWTRVAEVRCNGLVIPRLVSPKSSSVEMSTPKQFLVYEFDCGRAVERSDLALTFHVGQREQGTCRGSPPQDHPSCLQLRLLSQYIGGCRGSLRPFCRAVPEEYHLRAGATRRQRFRAIYG